MTLHSRNVGENLVFWNGHRKRVIDAIGPAVQKYIHNDAHSILAAADAPLGWVVTLVEAGIGESTITVPDAVPGEVLLTTDAAENDGINMQLDGEPFQLTSTVSVVYFSCELRTPDVTQSDILVGLCITDTDLLGGMTDGLYFRKVDGAATVSAVIEKDSAETAGATTHTLVNDTWTLFEIYIEQVAGVTTAYFFVTVAGAITLLATLSGANLPDDEALTPSIHFLTGEALAKTLRFRNLRAVQVGT